MGRLVLIGTGHVFRIGPQVHDAVLAIRPDVLFVELDAARLGALLERRQWTDAGVPPPSPARRKRRRAPLVQRRLQAFQERVAAMYGAQAGDEMLAAVDAAHKIGSRVVLADRPVEATLRRLVRGLTLREWLRLGGSVVANATRSLFRRRKGRDAVEAELRRYQEDPDAALAEIRRRFPTIYRAIIEERDAVMAQAIRQHLGDRVGVAVVGDGHVPGLQALLADLAPQAHRLADVREGRLPRPGTSDFSFSWSS